jgi:predicted transcriptional regulator
MGRKPDEAKAATIRALAAEGLSQTTIAAMMGVARHAINQFCRRHGIKCRPGYRDKDFADQVAQMIEDGMSVGEIKKATGREVVRTVKSLGLTPKWKGKRPGASGIRGVSLHKPSGGWRADVYESGRRRYLGCFRTKEEAAAALKAAE